MHQQVLTLTAEPLCLRSLTLLSGIPASLGETGDTLASEARFRTDDMRILERLAGHPLSLGLAGFAGGAMLFFVQHPLPL